MGLVARPLMGMNAEDIRTMPLDELLPMVKSELRANKLWREEYDDEDSEWSARLST